MEKFRSPMQLVDSGDVDLGFRFESTEEDLKNSNLFLSPVPEKKRKPRTTKSKKEDVIVLDSKGGLINSLPISYKDEYIETNNLIHQAIDQVEQFTTDVCVDLKTVRNKNNLPKKYDYISTLVGSQASLMHTKLGYIREMNNTIKVANDMEYKRIKDMKMGNEALDDNKLIMDLYTNMVRNPGQFSGMDQGLNSYTATIQNSAPITMGGGMGNMVTLDNGYNDYINNLSPEANMMLLENNPNVQEVVCYNQDTGAAYFDVYDVSTNMPVPNVPKKDQIWMENTIIDLQDGVARNNKLGESYKLILVGTSRIDNDVILSQY